MYAGDVNPFNVLVALNSYRSDFDIPKSPITRILTPPSSYSINIFSGFRSL